MKYGLYALKHTYNRGIKFKDFPVPAANLLKVEKGNGLTIAYHGLNLGRIALCANAAGSSMDQHALAGAQSGVSQRQPRGAECHRD